MSTHLGKITFLDTPDVNGANLLTAADLTNLIIPGTEGFTPPIGTTAQRPASPSLGETRYNSTVGKKEYWNGSVWIAPGEVLQVVTGIMTPTSYTAVNATAMLYDNNTPVSTRGLQLWSQSFTPVLATSMIIVTVSSFYTAGAATASFVIGALFNGTTAFHAAAIGRTALSGDGHAYSVTGQQTAGSTSTRTYSFRAGPVSNMLIYFGQGTGGQAFGSADSGIYSIMEIAP